MKIDLVGWGLPVLVIIISVPLVVGMVPPNGWYGFRTPKTLSSPAIWYAANRASGWFFIGAGLLTIGLNLALCRTQPKWPDAKLVFWMASADVVGLLLALIYSFWYLQRL